MTNSVLGQSHHWQCGNNIGTQTQGILFIHLLCLWYISGHYANSPETQTKTTSIVWLLRMEPPQKLAKALAKEPTKATPRRLPRKMAKPPRRLPRRINACDQVHFIGIFSAGSHSPPSGPPGQVFPEHLTWVFYPGSLTCRFLPSLQFITPKAYTPTMSGIHDFENKANLSTLDTEVEMIAVNKHLLRKDQVSLLLAAVEHLIDRDEVGYGADFDIKDEINSQIQMVRAMRRSVLGEDGKIKTDVATRDLKEVMAAGTTLTNLLMKSHEQILNADRQRAMETALKKAVETLDKPAQDRFFDTLETLLENIE